ncbi:hypothetical protein [Streptomyces sp. 049-1]|uniref:hypothetical protein n=1 Tax=Streptomyces sp. 049-1 TaxID=2789264 RepID=UPI0039811B60
MSNIPIPDVRTYGDVDWMTWQTDHRGAVLVAYTQDSEGVMTRTQMRIPPSGVAYLRARLAGGDAGDASAAPVHLVPPQDSAPQHTESPRASWAWRTRRTAP